MNPELRQFIDQALSHRGSVEGVAERLPADDAELDALIGETVQENDVKAFLHVVVAALSRERRMDARHLARGAMLFPNDGLLGAAALRMQGDVAKHLVNAIEHTRLKPACEAQALHLIAFWCQEHREGVLPGQLVPLARALARREPADVKIFSFLMATAGLANDAGLDALLRQRHPTLTDEQWNEKKINYREFGERMLGTYRLPVLAWTHDKPSTELASGNTMRRAVARVGRNDACHCGSGKKYKRCCYEKDQQRLHHSSEVAGLTHEELLAAPEPHLTVARLERTQPFEMARLDPLKIPAPLLEAYFLRLSAFNLLDRAVEAMARLGYIEPLAEAWNHVMFGAIRHGRKDIAEQLMKLRAPTGFTEDKLDLGGRLLLAEGDEAKCLQLINDAALKSLQSEDFEELMGFAYGVTISKYRALGIYLYRSAFPLTPPERLTPCFGQLLEARDRLNLPPDDPFSDYIDERLADRKDDGKDAAILRSAQRSLETKAQEVQQLKESLARLQKEIARHEKTAPTAPAVPTTAVMGDEKVLKELREKVEGLKSALKERHHERNALRRDLQKAQTDLETLRQNAAPAPTASDETGAAEREEALLLPQDAPEVHPVRLIEFPKGFQQTLGGFPRQVARAAMIMIGRLAAGEPAAFVGALRLKATPNVMRQRIGSDYRLFFRLHPEQMQVIDLINRKDLDRRLKTLA
jgi:hypothetical protein